MFYQNNSQSQETLDPQWSTILCLWQMVQSNGKSLPSLLRTTLYIYILSMNLILFLDLHQKNKLNSCPIVKCLEIYYNKYSTNSYLL